MARLSGLSWRNKKCSVIKEEKMDTTVLENEEKEAFWKEKRI
jgi:hypothetical protein